MSEENGNDVQISEKKLEDFVFDHLSGINLYTGFDLDDDYDFVYRQFSLGEYGVADIVSILKDYDGSLLIDIFELKKGVIDRDTLIQILRYKVGLDTILKNFGFNDYRINCILIGSCISGFNEFDIAINALDDLTFYKYGIDPNSGITIQKKEYNYREIPLPGSSNKKISCMNYLSHDQACSYYHHKLNINNKSK